jgi:hypothetical protein
MILSIVIYGQKKRREGRKLAKTARKNNTGANGMFRRKNPDSTKICSENINIRCLSS